MRKTNGTLSILAVLSVLIVASSPAVASTLTVTINPANRTAVLKSVSTTTIILTYPAGSSLSRTLNGYNSSRSYSGIFASSSNATLAIQNHFDDEDSHVRVQNMSVMFALSAKGNSTALVIHKETDITATVKGIFRVVNGTVHIGMGWRSFAVQGSLVMNLEDHPVDVNLVGSAFGEQLDDHPLIVGFLLGMFGGQRVWGSSTLNFSSLNTPLSTWTRNYDAITNTTTFSKTVSGETSLNVSADFNGQKYTLSVVSDPSASIQTRGYAVASGDSLTLVATPLFQSVAGWAIIGGVAVVVLATTAYALRRSWKKSAPSSTSSVANAEVQQTLRRA